MKRLAESCRWDTDQQAESSLVSLQVILNCASRQGCRECVPCSERALSLLLTAARNAGVLD